LPLTPSLHPPLAAKNKRGTEEEKKEVSFLYPISDNNDKENNKEGNQQKTNKKKRTKTKSKK
jgi:hypothetical protein